MHPAYASAPRRWIYALKPASWPKVLAPALLGHVLGYMAAETWSWEATAIGLAFAACATAYVVLVNDWFDADVDALKRAMFPHAGSPKTIPDAVLPAQSVLLAGCGAGAVALGVAMLAEARLPCPGGAAAAALGLGLLLLYSAPPLRLNDRGGGEVVEMIGVGLFVPWWSAYVQGGVVWSEWYTWALPGLMSLAFASAVASGLSDEESDRRGGKVTLTTSFGNRSARAVVEYAALAGVLAWVLAGRLSGGAFPLFAAQAALLVSAWPWRRLLLESPRAATGCFEAQARYKSALHVMIWGTTMALGLALLALRWLGWA